MLNIWIFIDDSGFFYEGRDVTLRIFEQGTRDFWEKIILDIHFQYISQNMSRGDL